MLKKLDVFSVLVPSWLLVEKGVFGSVFNLEGEVMLLEFLTDNDGSAINRLLARHPCAKISDQVKYHTDNFYIIKKGMFWKSSLNPIDVIPPRMCCALFQL